VALATIERVSSAKKKPFAPLMNAGKRGQKMGFSPAFLCISASKFFFFCSDQCDDERCWTQIYADKRRFFSGSASIRVNLRPIPLLPSG
jgi:hypothetical protein